MYKIDKRCGSFYNILILFFYVGVVSTHILTIVTIKYDILQLYVMLLVIRYEVGIQCC